MSQDVPSHQEVPGSQRLRGVPGVPMGWGGGKAEPVTPASHMGKGRGATGGKWGHLHRLQRVQLGHGDLGVQVGPGRDREKAQSENVPGLPPQSDTGPGAGQGHLPWGPHHPFHPSHQLDPATPGVRESINKAGGA